MPLQSLPMARLVALVAELRQLPGWPYCEANLALVVGETLRAVGWPDAMIAAAVGLDPAAVEAAAVEVTG